MSSMMKHVGKVKSTDRRCVLVFMQLPDNPSAALIVDVESLTPRFEQIIREMVESKEGQEVENFADYMTRRSVPETGRNVLNEFHVNGLMRLEPVDNIILVPFPNQPIALVDVLAAKGTLPNEFKEKAIAREEQFNTTVNNLKALKEEERLRMAQGFLFEAEIIEQEARTKREEAYKMAPELRPRAPQATKPAVEIATAESEVAPTKKSRGRPAKTTDADKSVKAAD